MLIEVAKIRLHGFSEREISIVRALLMSEIEYAYLERDQMQSTSLRDEYLQHFLRNEPVVGIEYEAQLRKTLLPLTTTNQAVMALKMLRENRNEFDLVINDVICQTSMVLSSLSLWGLKWTSLSLVSLSFALFFEIFLVLWCLQNLSIISYFVSRKNCFRTKLKIIIRRIRELLPVVAFASVCKR